MKCRGLLLAALGVAIFACSSDPARSAVTVPCNGLADFRFESGGDGHADPFGAKAAGQARAGKIVDAAQIVRSPVARHHVRVGDFALANDRIAVYIEAEGRADGYSPFGGDIVAIEPVGADGKPTGVSQYGETLVALSRQTVRPDKVSVIADGSDGKAAIVRVSGVLENIPFLDTFKALSQAEYGFPAAIDYVLEPGAEKITYRLSIANASDELVDFANLQRVGFFHASRSKIFTEANGFGAPKGEVPWVAFDSGESAFLVRAAEGRPIRSELEVSGFQLFSVQGLSAEACETKTVDYLELATGSPGIDGLLEAKRRAYGEPAWREVRGTLKEEGGEGLGGALVHATAPDGRYLTRALTDAEGGYVLHVPPGAVSLTPTLKGWAIPPATAVADGAATADLTLPRRATIEVKATDGATGDAIPVRVQVIPAKPPTPAPDTFGLREELNGRLWQDFAVTGNTVLPVPPGDYRVIVSRGYEYDILDTPVSASAAVPAVIDAALPRAVDTTGVMCADFHIHSFYSADSSDPADEKVKGAIADGLDIPVSSEHEWVIDFQPIIQRLGLTKWAFGMPSEELTTFTWGHFGVIPLYPREGAPNNGAIDWVGKQPPGFFKQVNELPEKPVLIINHPSSAGFGGYFSAASLDRATGKGDPELWSNEFGAIEVFNDSDLEENRDKSVADWFALLNAGHTYWATGASDSHDQRSSPVGYPRTCLRFGHDDPTRLTPELVRDALRAGAGTISGGLYITAQAPDGVGPGGTSTAGAYDVVVQAPSWLAATSLEVIVDGVTTETIPLTALPGADPGNRYEVTVNVAASQSSARHWVVFHAKGGGDLSPVHPNRTPFAVTNPIFF
ncbi:MAG: CehA/McbA family metallohydrolase [Labilithrix sp.]|nr:CehA/McbA family metallohydrolase [Labilithrix sp.]